jgi:hypothetical protein
MVFFGENNYREIAENNCKMNRIKFLPKELQKESQQFFTERIHIENHR